MYTECTVSHLLALFFYAAKKSELRSNKKKAVADDDLDTKFTMQKGAREHLLIILTFDSPSAPKIKNRLCQLRSSQQVSQKLVNYIRTQKLGSTGIDGHLIKYV